MNIIPYAALLGVLLVAGCRHAPSALSPPPFRPQEDGLDSLAVWAAPESPRPFLLANRTGSYFYGSTGDAWDSGWMGLWIDRERLLSSIEIRDADGAPLNPGDAWCRVTPADVTWIWEDEPRREISLFFADRTDTLYCSSDSGIRIAGDARIQPHRPGAGRPLRGELLGELSHSAFHCADKTYSRALDWANLQLLFLLAEDDSLMYAGIPWFNEGWGRDTFISLPGLLVTGHTEAARKILMRFAGWVDRDPASPTFGRIPNRVRPGEEIVYNTADGTPWWIREIFDYGRYARDYRTWGELLADSGAVRVALDGALQNCDSSGFPVHGDADTWMDAVGPDGPESPRGNRAVEITALHAASLNAAARMGLAAREVVPTDLRNRWVKERDRLGRSFLGAFLAPEQNRLWDRIRTDGRPDTVTRPNQLFALTVPFVPLVPPTVQSRITEFVTRELVHEHGVLSLSPRDTIFHPYHMDEHYPKDDAYHQGIVWVWQSGPVKTALRMEGRADLALKIADYEARLMQERGLVGSLPELLDARPRPGTDEPNLSGTTTQAWSLAEFLRTTYQDLLGIRPVHERTRIEPFWLIDPRIPEEWGRVTARVHLEGVPLHVAMQNHGDSMTVALLPETEPEHPIALKLFHPREGITGYLNAAEPVHFTYVVEEGIAYTDGTPTAQLTLRGWPYDAGPQNIRFADPITRDDFPTLRDPEWDMLTGGDVLNPKGGEIVWRAEDPVGDDTGPGTFLYPLDTHFEPGILDLRELTVTEEADRYCFDLRLEKLSQPGWHPEYGFQLTYAALCLRTPGGTRGPVGANSNYVFESGPLASRIVFVGGGVRVEDESGERLAEFIPRSTEDAFGSVETGRIAFCLSKHYFPDDAPNGIWTVLVGAQDDHGGAGLGEFRSVNAEAERWAGGGRTDPDQSNVYDVGHSGPVQE